MQIKVNGETREFSAPLNVQSMAETLGINTRQVAVERNRQIVPRSRYAAEALSEGDVIEIVQFIGGG